MHVLRPADARRSASPGRDPDPGVDHRHHCRHHHSSSCSRPAWDSPGEAGRPLSRTDSAGPLSFRSACGSGTMPWPPLRPPRPPGRSPQGPRPRARVACIYNVGVTGGGDVVAVCRPDELRVRDVHPQGGIRDAVRPASAASGCRMPARPGPQAGGRPTQPDQDQEDEDQGEEQQEKKPG